MAQGALQLTRLLSERVAGQPLARRIVAAYVIGWPISTATDLPKLGLPGCTSAGESGCIIAWQSYAEPADPHMVQSLYDASTGLDGRPRRGTPMLCVNPLTGTAGGRAPASANSGSLVPTTDLNDATIAPGRVPARCDSSGFLLIGPPPAGFGRYVMPGNNYHVYDMALFWMNIRNDVAARNAIAWLLQPLDDRALLHVGAERRHEEVAHVGLTSASAAARMVSAWGTAASSRCFG